MKKTAILSAIIITLSFALTTTSNAGTKLFSCKPLVSIFDPTYQQGDDIYVDIYINAKNQTQLQYATSIGPTVTLFDYDDLTHFHLDLEQSTSLSEWKNETYISMVYIGEKWGAVLKFPKALTKDHLTFTAGEEKDLLCTESEFFETLQRETL